MRILAGMANVTEKIASDLAALGVVGGDVLLVHSSLSALGYVPGGPPAVIDGLLRAIGPAGTLLLPGLSYASVNESRPSFDVRTTPCCVGMIPEYFRTLPGVRRSVHPTHSVCGIGPRADELLSDHQLDTTPVGPHSPFRRIRQVGGKILMLGCGLRPNTFMHGVEEVVEPPYLLKEPVQYLITLANGETIIMGVRRHNFHGYIQRYDRVEGLLSTSELRTGYVLSAYCHLLDTLALDAKGLAALRQDPFHFVERVS